MNDRWVDVGSLPSANMPSATSVRRSPSFLPAVIAWVSVVVALNVTVQPLIAAACYVSLAAYAWCVGQRRIIAISLLVGAGLLFVIPGVSVAAGGWSLTFGPSANWLPEPTPIGIGLAIASVLRVPAQVVAVALVFSVPGPRLLAGAERLSPRGALLGALAARARTLLSSDVQHVRDELVVMGRVADRSGTLSDRVRGARIVWESVLTGAFDRAFATAASLQVRGYGTRRGSGVELRDPRLATSAPRSPALDLLVAGSGIGLVCGVIAGRITGSIPAPVIQVFSGIREPVTAYVVVLSLAACIGFSAAAVLVRRHPVIADEPRHDSMGEVPVMTLAARSGSHPVCVLSGVRVMHATRSDAALAIDHCEFRRAEIVLLAGASGSGKTTMLDLITGIAEPVVGARVAGTVQRPDSLGVVFQDPERQVVLEHVADDVISSIGADGVSRLEIEARVLAALGVVGCVHLARRRCDSLSGGELQRIMVAAAIARRSDMVVLDEPSASLDVPGEQRLWSEVRRIRDELGVAVVIAEHRVERVWQHVDRVIVLDHGRIIHDGEPDDMAWSHLQQLGVVQPLRPSTIITDATASAPALELVRFEVPHPSGRGSVVRDAALALPSGGVLAVTGDNGSGKTTLLRALAGIGSCRGQVLIRGRATHQRPVQRDMWWVTQRPAAVVLGATVREHLARVAGDSPDRVAWLLQDCGLAEHAEHHPGDLSIGERQRLSIAVAMSSRRMVWLLDEPTRGMDGRARTWIAARIAAHARGGGVVVLASHDEWLVAAVASHRLTLGTARAPGTVVRRSNIANLRDGEVSV